MYKSDLRVLISFLEYENEKAIVYFMSKLTELISRNEDEFFKCIGVTLENFPLRNGQEPWPWQEHSVIHINLNNEVVSTIYEFQNFIVPIYEFTVSSNQIEHFSKSDELKSLHGGVIYFRRTSLELRRFLEEESQKYTLSELLRTYPELYEFTKKRFRFRSKLDPHKDQKKLKTLPKHLGDYIRKVQFFEKVSNS
jgi:hypothetical protein